LTNKFILLIIFVFYTVHSADINFTLQKAWDTQGFHPIYSAGALFKSDKLNYTYYEFGISCLPRNYKTSDNSQVPDNSHMYSFYGIYGGYYIAIIPAFRPGVLLGTVLTQNAEYYTNSKRPSSINKLSINYYAGLSIHVFFLTFTITNNGIGGGVNLPLSN